MTYDEHLLQTWSLPNHDADDIHAPGVRHHGGVHRRLLELHVAALRRRLHVTQRKPLWLRHQLVTSHKVHVDVDALLNFCIQYARALLQLQRHHHGTLVSVLGFIIAVMELTGPKYRAVIGCLYQMLYSFGVMLLPVMAYFVRDYTGMLLCMAAPAASALFLGV